MEVKINDKIGDKILVMSSAQYAQFEADPDGFVAWLDRTGRFPQPEPEPEKSAGAVAKFLKPSKK